MYNLYRTTNSTNYVNELFNLFTRIKNFLPERQNKEETRSTGPTATRTRKDKSTTRSQYGLGAQEYH